MKTARQLVRSLANWGLLAVLCSAVPLATEAASQQQRYPMPVDPILGKWVFRPEAGAEVTAFTITFSPEPRLMSASMTAFAADKMNKFVLTGSNGLEGTGEFQGTEGHFRTAGRGGVSKLARFEILPKGLIRLEVTGSGNDPLPLGTFVGQRAVE